MVPGGYSLGEVSDRDAPHRPSTRNATRVKRGGRNFTFCPILMKNTGWNTFPNFFLLKYRGQNTTFSSFLLKYRGRNHTNFPETWKRGVKMEEHIYSNLQRMSTPTPTPPPHHPPPPPIHPTHPHPPPPHPTHPAPWCLGHLSIPPSITCRFGVFVYFREHTDLFLQFSRLSTLEYITIWKHWLVYSRISIIPTDNLVRATRSQGICNNCVLPSFPEILYLLVVSQYAL